MDGHKNRMQILWRPRSVANVGWSNPPFMRPCIMCHGEGYELIPGNTFNLVWGCTKVSSGCKNCYAEALAKRYGYDVWGNTSRRPMSENYWKQPLVWDKRATKNGWREKVFCGSMCDWAEEHPDLREPRRRLCRDLIPATPNLDWLLLTKRPQNIIDFVPTEWRAHKFGKVPTNVWLGTSAEDQKNFDARQAAMAKVDYLLQPPVIFFSVEPMLGPVDISALKARKWEAKLWIICGGESGKDFRPMDLSWARSLRDQCKEMDIPFYFKQQSGLRAGTGHELDGVTYWNWPRLDNGNQDAGGR